MVVAENLCLKHLFPVSIVVANSEKVKVEEVVAKNLNLKLSFTVSIAAANSEKVKVEEIVAKNLNLNARTLVPAPDLFWRQFGRAAMMPARKVRWLNRQL